jgi:UrcA family protein
MLRPLIAAALFAILATPPAFGADRQQAPQHVIVPVADLDLDSAAGKAELRARVALAASRLCRPDWMTKNPDSEFAIRYNQEIHRACVGRLTDRALARFNAG